MRPQKVGLWTPWGGSASAFNKKKKTDNSSRNRPYKAPGLQNDCPGFKNDRNLFTLLVKQQHSSQENKEIKAN
jgi:hypothetical protein